MASTSAPETVEVTTEADPEQGSGGGGDGSAEPVSDPLESAPEEPASDGGWPGGSGYTAILASKPSEAEAKSIRRDAVAQGLDAGLLFSSDYSSLNPGYWVVFSGTFDSKQEAAAEADAVEASGFAGSYAREITP